MKYLVLLSGFFIPFVAFSQDKCGFDIIHQNLLKTNLNYKEEFNSHNKKLGDNYSRKDLRVKKIESNIYKIPIVVHIMHNGEGIGYGTNIDDITVFNSINYLNKVYNGTSAGNETDIQIQFELAKRTPSDECTTGIDRINASSIPNYSQFGVKSSVTIPGNGCLDLDLKNFARWNPTNYLNIWVVNKIVDRNYSLDGYAYRPSQFISIDLDGIVIISSSLNSSTLPHEMGHCLDLLHIFDNLNDVCRIPTILCPFSGDYVCDTDPVSEHVECNSSDEINPCTNNPYQDNTERNIMGYTRCQWLFTNGQKIRMHESMNLPRRESLIRSNNLALKSPKADLKIITQAANPLIVPAGGPISLSFAENNAGFYPAGQNYVSFHLSSDTILTPGQNGDKWVGEYLVTGVGAQSNTLQYNTQITIPLNTASGQYYLIYAADGNPTVPECNELNNFATVIINVVNAACSKPNVPLINSATNITQTSFKASWNASLNADSYFLDVSTSSTFSPETFVSGYKNIEIIGTNKTVTGVFCNSVYFYRIRANRTCGSASNYSSFSPVTTLSCGTSGGGGPVNDNCIFAILLTPSIVCNNVSGNLNGATSSGINKPNCDGYSNPSMKDIWYKFTANSTGVFSINVTAQTGFDAVTTLYNGCNGTELYCSDIPNSPNSFISANLISGATYYLRVYDFGITDPPNPNFNICVISPVSCSYPLAPTINSATNIGQNSFQVNWNLVNGATKYYIDISNNSDFTNYSNGFQNYYLGASSSANITNLNCNTTYFYRIRAENNCGQSTNSAVFSILTQTCFCSQVPECYVGMNTHYRINAGYTIQWNASGTNGPDRYEWTFPGGTPSTSIETSPIIKYDNPGIYGATLRAHNNCGWSKLNVQNNMAFVLEPCSSPPIAPIAITSTSFPGTFIGNWNHSEGAIYYIVDWAYDSNFTRFIFRDLYSGEDTKYAWTTGPCEKRFWYYRVRAVNNCGVSANSNYSQINYNFIPLAPNSISGNTKVNTGSKTSLFANGCSGIVKWYDSMISGNLIFTGNPFETNNLNFNTDYFTSCITNTCESETRTKVSVQVCSIIIESQNSGNWNDPNTWSCGMIPTINNKVIINNGHTISISVGDLGNCLNIETKNGAILNVPIGAKLLVKP